VPLKLTHALTALPPAVSKLSEPLIVDGMLVP